MGLNESSAITWKSKFSTHYFFQKKTLWLLSPIYLKNIFLLIQQGWFNKWVENVHFAKWISYIKISGNLG